MTKLIIDAAGPRELALTPDEEAEFAQRQSALPPVPSLTRRQLRLMLVHLGLSSAAVESQIDAIPDATQRELSRIEWQDSATYHHDHPLVSEIGTALGLTPEQIVEAFRAASQL